jgi:hypothetical protein
MRSLLALAVTAAFAAPLAAPAADAPAAKVLRTLVYSVQLSTLTKNEEQTSGFNAGGNGGAIGHGAVARSSEASDDGSLTIDVIGATADLGLVVDAAFAGKNSQQPAIRVAIFPDGHLAYDPARQLSVEAARVLPLLSRGLLNGRDVAPGATWKTVAPAPAKGVMTYRIIDVHGTQATIGIEADLKVPGPRGYDEQDQGKTTYATDRVCPVIVDLQSRTRRSPSADQYVTTTAHISATLVSDSFAKK